MGLQQYQPAAPLNALIEKIWDWDMPPQLHRFERVLPLPGAALIINLHEDETRVYADDENRTCTRSAAAILGGPMLGSQIIDTAEQVRVMGVVFALAEHMHLPARILRPARSETSICMTCSDPRQARCDSACSKPPRRQRVSHCWNNG